MNRILISFGAAAVLASAGCSSYRDRIAETALQGGHARYDDRGQLFQMYEYYPEFEVYRSVYGGTWHWRNEQGSWYRSAQLPATTNVSGSYSVIVELPTNQPSTHHAHVARTHPSTSVLRAQAAAIQDEHYIGSDGEEAYATAPINE